MSEYAHQKAVVEFHRRCVPPDRGMLFAIPNAGRRTPAEASMRKAEGMVTGAPDLILALPAGQTIWIEMKRPARPKPQFGRPGIAHRAGKTNEAQDEVRSRLMALGHRHVILHTLDEYISLLEEAGVPHRAVTAPTRRLGL